MEIFNLKKYFEFLENNQIKEAKEYRASFVPEYIYKYISLSNDKSTNELKFSSLENNQIWFSAPSCLNDPYEFKGMEINREELIKKGMTDSKIDEVLSFIKSVFVACFSGDVSNQNQMWAYYANNHQGLCLKYKVNNKKAIRNVIYEPVSIDITKIFSQFVECANILENSKDNNIEIIQKLKIYSILLLDMYFIKQARWKGENEFRLILPKGDLAGTECGENKKSNDYGLQLCEVYCGLKCSEENKNRTSEICRKLNVPCKQCQMGDIGGIPGVISY